MTLLSDKEKAQLSKDFLDKLPQSKEPVSVRLNASEGYLKNLSLQLRAMLANTALLEKFDHRGKFTSKEARDFVVWRSFDQAAAALPSFFGETGEIKYSTLAINVSYRKIFFVGTYKSMAVVGYIPLILRIDDKDLLKENVIDVALLPRTEEARLRLRSLERLIQQSNTPNKATNVEELNRTMDDVLGFNLQKNTPMIAGLDGFSSISGRIPSNRVIKTEIIDAYSSQVVYKPYFGESSMNLHCNADMIVVTSELFSDVARETKGFSVLEKVYVRSPYIPEEHLVLAAQRWLESASRP